MRDDGADDKLHSPSTASAGRNQPEPESDYQSDDDNDGAERGGKRRRLVSVSYVLPLGLLIAPPCHHAVSDCPLVSMSPHCLYFPCPCFLIFHVSIILTSLR